MTTHIATIGPLSFDGTCTLNGVNPPTYSYSFTDSAGGSVWFPPTGSGMLTTAADTPSAFASFTGVDFHGASKNVALEVMTADRLLITMRLNISTDGTSSGGKATGFSTALPTSAG